MIWIKNVMVLGRGDYHHRHEAVLYGWRQDAAHYFCPDRKQDSVFEIDPEKLRRLSDAMVADLRHDV